MTAAEPRRPVGEVLQGLDVLPLPTGWTPMEAFVVVKCLDESGHATWCTRTTSRMNDEELLGALVLQTEMVKREMLGDWTGSRHDDDD